MGAAAANGGLSNVGFILDGATIAKSAYLERWHIKMA